MSDYHTNTLKEAVLRLNNYPFLATAVRRLTENSIALNTELTEAVLAEIPAFSVSRNPDILPDLARHGSEQTNEILRLLGGGSVSDFEFVRQHARHRAEQHFPLEATLHAYRCGHKLFSRWIRDALLKAASSNDSAQQIVAAVADFTIEYTDAISTIAASTYVSQIRLLAEVAGDHRVELLNILLDGYDESDGRVAKILGDAGYLDRRQSFCVALVEPVDPTEMLNPARARRLADSIDEIMRKSTTHRLIDLRDNKVTIVFSDTRRTSGWTAPNTRLAKRITSELSMVGNAVLIGVSNDVPSTSQIPIAHNQALLALQLADVTHRVVQISDLSVQRLMLHLAGTEFQRLLPAWTNAFFAADEKSGGRLVTTLRAYANTNMNVLKAAEKLSIHPNTIYARFEKIFDITGLDAKCYRTLTELLIVIDCMQLSATDTHEDYSTAAASL